MTYIVKARCSLVAMFVLQADDEEHAKEIVERWGTTLPHDVLSQEVEVEEVERGST